MKERSAIAAAYFYRRVMRGPLTRKRWRHVWRQIKNRLDAWRATWRERADAKRDADLEEAVERLAESEWKRICPEIPEG